MKPLLWILQFVVGCRHRHQSRVFTIKNRTYRVCVDCGREFDLPDAQAAKQSVLLRMPPGHKSPSAS
jgi:hypothetical protein